MIEWKALPHSVSQVYSSVFLLPRRVVGALQGTGLGPLLLPCAPCHQSGSVISRGEFSYSVSKWGELSLWAHRWVRKSLGGEEERPGCLQQIVSWVVVGWVTGNLVLRSRLTKWLPSWRGSLMVQFQTSTKGGGCFLFDKILSSGSEEME